MTDPYDTSETTSPVAAAPEEMTRSILVDLARVPAHVDQIVFPVNSFTGQTFAEVQDAFCRLVDERNGELARYALSGGGTYTARIMAKLHRE